MNNKTPWYKGWFDSPYYHILYKNRNEQEAKYFIDNLVNHLSMKKGDKVLDLACGKGRHALQLHENGMEVIGVDLSSYSIDQAKKYETEGLKFVRHDMREFYKKNYFDHVLNMFSSFGYFNNDEENKKVINAAKFSLKKGGKFVLDFMNSEFVKKNMIKSESLIREGIKFHVRREIKNNMIIKHIQFYSEGKSHEFEEKVRLLNKKDLREMILSTGMNIIDIMGDYDLNPFEEKNSERLIIISQK
ncbi:MAG: class I SAM-dependent methyltransferase [Flavobacteriales bacterium]